MSLISVAPGTDPMRGPAEQGGGGRGRTTMRLLMHRTRGWDRGPSRDVLPRGPALAGRRSEAVPWQGRDLRQGRVPRPRTAPGEGPCCAPVPPTAEEGRPRGGLGGPRGSTARPVHGAQQTPARPSLPPGSSAPGEQNPEFPHVPVPGMLHHGSCVFSKRYSNLIQQEKVVAENCLYVWEILSAGSTERLTEPP